jgi:hypothetical protein
MWLDRGAPPTVLAHRSQVRSPLVVTALVLVADGRSAAPVARWSCRSCAPASAKRSRHLGRMAV